MFEDPLENFLVSPITHELYVPIEVKFVKTRAFFIRNKKAVFNKFNLNIGGQNSSVIGVSELIIQIEPMKIVFSQKWFSIQLKVK